MNRSELVRGVAQREGITLQLAGAVVDTVIDTMTEALCEGRRVEIRGFGTFRNRYYPGYLGRNPRTDERVLVDAKVLPVFRAGRELVLRVNPTSAKEEEP